MISSISCDAHCLDLVITLSCGGSLVMPKPHGQLEPSYIIDTIQKQQVNSILMSVPSLMREYLAVMHGCEHMRVWVTGGEPVPLLMLKRAKELMPNVQLVAVYGEYLQG
jgi:non-ribosomal peptide synthetase component F